LDSGGSGDLFASVAEWFNICLRGKQIEEWRAAIIHAYFAYFGRSNLLARAYSPLYSNRALCGRWAMFKIDRF